MASCEDEEVTFWHTGAVCWYTAADRREAELDAQPDAGLVETHCVKSLVHGCLLPMLTYESPRAKIMPRSTLCFNDISSLLPTEMDTIITLKSRREPRIAAVTMDVV